MQQGRDFEALTTPDRGRLYTFRLFSDIGKFFSMGYRFHFPDIAASRKAVEQLNDACKHMKDTWTGIVDNDPCSVNPLLSFLRDFLKEDSGAEIFYFVTPPESTKNMARRLCAALRLVSETIYEEEELKIDFAQQLYKETAWSAHCSKSGKRAEREGRGHGYRDDAIDVKRIESITRLVNDLCFEVFRQGI